MEDGQHLFRFCSLSQVRTLGKLGLHSNLPDFLSLKTGSCSISSFSKHGWPLQFSYSLFYCNSLEYVDQQKQWKFFDKNLFFWSTLDRVVATIQLCLTQNQIFSQPQTAKLDLGFLYPPEKDPIVPPGLFCSYQVEVNWFFQSHNSGKWSLEENQP